MPPKDTSMLDKSLQIHLDTKRSRDSIKLGSINAIILGLILYDMNSGLKYCPGETLFWYYVKCIAASICGMSLLYYLLSYISCKFFIDPVKGTSENQRKLLGLLDKSFVVQPQKKPGSLDVSKPDAFNISAQLTLPNWFNNSANNQTMNASYSLNATDQNTSYASSVNNSFQTPSKYIASKVPISDQLTLSTYLNEIEQKEKNLSTAMETQNNLSGFNTSNSFWSPNTSGRFGMLDDISTLLKTTIYQLSPVQNKQPAKDEMIFSSSTKSITPTEDEIKKISSAKLSNYVANLRMWISSTILNRLVSEFQKIDEAFQQRSMGDLKIGQVGLERLKKTGDNLQLVQIVPQLPMLIPYLDLTSNQEYLVNRIKELAKGSCLANYKWNSGSISGSNDEHTPTDSAIIFHLFCAYMDSLLYRSPDCVRSFYDRYVVLSDTKKTSKEILNMVQNKSKCAILVHNPIKPKFNFISGDKIHMFTHDRNNLFYVIIQFLIYVKENYNGNLEGVNLGKSGLNILCVVED